MYVWSFLFKFNEQNSNVFMSLQLLSEKYLALIAMVSNVRHLKNDQK